MATKSDPIPMLIAGVGFLLVYAGIKDKSPLVLAKSLAQGKNPTGATSPAPVVTPIPGTIPGEFANGFDYGGSQSWGPSTPSQTPQAGPFRSQTPMP